MNRAQLSAFMAVADAGGFTKGAEWLMISQPAVSLHVAELEATLKTKLFDRLPRGVRLTAAGQLLATYARRIVALEHEAESAVAELMGLTRGRLTVGASLTIGSYLLPGKLGEFRRQYPQIELTLEIANTQQIERLLIDDRIDLAFTEGLATNTGFSATVLQNDRLVPIAPPRHPILRHRRITAAMFCKQGLILREPGSGTRAVIEDAMARRRVSVKPQMSLGSAEAIKRAVAAGVGLSIVSELVIENELAAGTLVIVPVLDLSITRPLVLLRMPGKSDSPSAKAFVRLLQQR